MNPAHKKRHKTLDSKAFIKEPYDKMTAFQPERFDFRGGMGILPTGGVQIPVFSMDSLTALTFGALILLIGTFTTYRNVRSTQGPKERAFVTRSNISAWVVVMLFFALLYFVPHPYNYLLVVVYFAVFPFAVYQFCSTRLLIRRMEEMHAAGHKA